MYNLGYLCMVNMKEILTLRIIFIYISYSAKGTKTKSFVQIFFKTLSSVYSGCGHINIGVNTLKVPIYLLIVPVISYIFMLGLFPF